MKPILFNTEQVRNILDGRKTNTRRPIKQSGWLERPLSREKDGSVWFATNRYTQFCCKPLYKRGDILYVREAWAREECQSCLSGITPSVVYCQCRYVYKAGGERHIKWHPSIHMPKEAARIFLKVTDVRVDRLQNITEEDAIKEGETGVRCECLHKELGGGMYGCTDCMNTGWLEPPTMYFMYDWNAIYARRGYSWEANPWVWVYEFEQMKGEQG